MKDHQHKIFTPTDCIPEQTMFDYIDNKLPAKERHLVEKHLLDCELCSDAMEGLELVKDRSRIGVINRKVNELIAPAPEKKIIGINYRTISAIAAGLALLIGSIFFFQLSSDKMKEEKSIADLKAPAPAPPPIDTEEEIQDSTDQEIQPEHKDKVQSNANKKFQEPYATNQPPPVNETKGPPAPATPVVPGAATPVPEQTTQDMDIVLADEGYKKQDKPERDDQEMLNNATYSWTPTPSKNAETVTPKEKDRRKKSAKPSAPENDGKQPSYGLASPTPQSAPSGYDFDMAKREPLTPSADSITRTDSVYTVAEKMPEFPGGYNEMLKFIAANIKYPPLEKESAVTGTVFAQFIVNKEGKIIQPKIIKSLTPGADAEVIRVIKMMPQWNPGKQNGKEVSVRYNLPVKFGLK